MERLLKEKPPKKQLNLLQQEAASGSYRSLWDCNHTQFEADLAYRGHGDWKLKMENGLITGIQHKPNDPPVIHAPPPPKQFPERGKSPFLF
jgi:hypothetical protein